MAEIGSSHCTTCGAVIQQATAARTGGLCMPCESGRKRVRERVPSRAGPIEQKRYVDWMCIGIEKAAETAAYADYGFAVDVYEPDPQRASRMVRVGQNRGRMRVWKATGEVALLDPMPEDDGNQRFHRAAAKIRKHWAVGAYPEKTMFACG